MLGFGGFGITYSARDNNLDKIVAIKEYLPSELAARVDGSTVSPKSEQDKEGFDWGLERFLDEAKTVAKYNHPNIVRIYRFFELNGTGYIVMDLIKGDTLHSLLEELGTIDESQIRAWLWPIMDGLREVHATGFLHRDIKPQNIMMSEKGVPILLDFGAARMAMGGRTVSLTSIMTPGYAPIEQYASRGKQGPWTDIYALGAVMYRCVTGRKPLDAMDRAIDDSLDAPESGTDKTHSEKLLKGISAALKADASQRPQNLDGWLEILDSGDNATVKMSKSQPPDIASMPAPELMRKSGPARWLLAVIPFLLVVVAAGYWFAKNESGQIQEATVAQLPDSSDEQERPLIEEPAQANNMDNDVEESTTAPVEEKPIPVPYEGIRITSEPSGAGIYIDSEYVGTTPSELSEFEPGRMATVRLELEGFEPAEQMFTAPNEGMGEVSLDLQRAAYALTVVTDPPDALVRLVDPDREYHPGMLLDPGSYRYEVSRQGYRKQQGEVRVVDADQSPRITLVAGLEPGKVFRDCDECPEMVVIPSGSFMMGSPASEIGRDDDEGPQHRVSISRAFALGRYEVTFEEFDAFARNTGRKVPDDRGWGRGRHPAINASWNDAQAYVKWLSTKTGKSYRLPSESEWEYAARAGATTAFWWGNEVGTNRANCDGCGSRWDYKQTAPTGSFAANPFGLYDTSGNVWEWTADCFNGSYQDAQSNGSAWLTGDCGRRVLRGGSWYYGPLDLRSAGRGWSSVTGRNGSTGFRVAQDLPP